MKRKAIEEFEKERTSQLEKVRQLVTTTKTEDQIKRDRQLREAEATAQKLVGVGCNVLIFRKTSGRNIN